VQGRPGVHFINVLLEAFRLTDAKSAKNTDTFTEFLRFWDLRVQKLYVNMLVKSTTGVDPTKLFIFRFFFFGVKIGHFTFNNFFQYVAKTQAYQRKTEKFFVSEEKKFGRIDSRCQFRQHFSSSFFSQYIPLQKNTNTKTLSFEKMQITFLLAKCC